MAWYSRHRPGFGLIPGHPGCANDRPDDAGWFGLQGKSIHEKEVGIVLKKVGMAVAISAALIAWGMMGTSSSVAEESAAPVDVTCKYQGEVYPAGELVCWHDGYWYRCDGTTGQWRNQRQKCKIM
jgi:hypothetical protein